MPKRKYGCAAAEVRSMQVMTRAAKRAKAQLESCKEETSDRESNESQHTEQLLHRGSVTPPQKQPVRRQSRKRSSFSSSSTGVCSVSDRSCQASANSGVKSDALQYDADDALYYPGTDLVIDGWFQPCRGCGAFTAGQLEADSKSAPVCYRCQEKLTHAVEGILPPHYTPDQSGPADYFKAWMKIRVPMSRQRCQADRLKVKHDLVIKMHEHWVRCREEARAANCRIPCA